VRIASYNIRKAIGLDWRRDPDRILDVLDEIQADILVLQEGDRRYGTRAGVLPIERLADDFGFTLAEVSIRPQSHGWHGNIVLVRHGFPIHATERIVLPYVDPRGAVRVALEDVEIVGTHLGLTPGTRRKQLKKLTEDVAAAGRPVILAGDFNEWNTENFSMSSRLTLVTPGPSYHASRPIGALDRFIVNDGIRVLQATVHRSDLARQASDHLPVVMDFEIVSPE